jgi:hypothetical protein
MSAYAQSREVPRAGDSWTYRLTEHPQGRKPVQSRYVVKVKASSGTKVLDEVSRDGATPFEWTHSPGWYMVPQVVSVFSPYLVVFEELKPGDRIWRVTEHDDICFGWVYCATVGRVEKREILQLAAGSFDTIKVTLDQIVTKRPGPMVGASSGSRSLTIWYSLQAKRAIKVTSRMSGHLSTPFFISFDLELESHQVH